jgi:hypothetical protein
MTSVMTVDEIEQVWFFEHVLFTSREDLPYRKRVSSEDHANEL